MSAIPKAVDLGSSGIRVRLFSDVSASLKTSNGAAETEKQIVKKKFKDHYFITDSEQILKRESCLRYRNILLSN